MAASSVEVLITGEESVIGTAALRATVDGALQAGLQVSTTRSYAGLSDWLCMFGAGEPKRNAAMQAHLRTGRHVACWDIAYFGRGKIPEKSYVRVSIDHTHPLPRYMDSTPNDDTRWRTHAIALREDADAEGHVIVVGLGPKSRIHLQLFDWEKRTLASARKRFPTRKIVYRPKRDSTLIPWEQDGTTPIADLLRRASLVICRHSNVALDAAIAGVPVECEDGAAWWLYRNGSTPKRAARLDLLHRVCYWQYQLREMAQAWKFLTGVAGVAAA